MRLDDLLPSSSDRRWRPLLTTPLLPLFWLARITGRAVGALASRFGIEDPAFWLVRRLGYRHTLDYVATYPYPVSTDDAEVLMTGTTQPGKRFENVLAETVTDEPDGWRGRVRSLRLRTRYESERAVATIQGGLETLRARARTAFRTILDALPATRIGGDER